MSLKKKRHFVGPQQKELELSDWKAEIGV